MRPIRTTSDRALTTALSRWFLRHARPLPWRTTPRDPYRSLVSEVMLQQTQVSRVLEKYEPFLARFPTLQSLAAAPEQQILAEWSGLGYYSRARNLHAAAKTIASDHNARVPQNVDDLRALPGVGRYTAGAIASVVYGHPAPIVDGNVTRVLLRLDGKPLTHGSPEALRWSWSRAESLVAAANDPAAFNEGLMELGATICTPRNPGCPRCPVRSGCVARAKNLQNDIPRPKPQAARKPLHCAAALLTDTQGRRLVEPRPARGLWANMWQAPTLEAPTAPTAPTLRDWLGLPTLKRSSQFPHGTTHRDVVFHLWQAPPLATATARRLSKLRPASRWLSEPDIAALPLSNPQRRILLGNGS